jgi:hypothetical protein
MHNRVISLAACVSLLALVFVVGCSVVGKKSKASLPGTWQSTPIVIDGDSKDWPSPYPNYDSKAMVAYATSNDRKNLYVTVESGDEMTQMKILKRGLTVSIDTGGGKSPEFNINYPLENDNDPLEFPKKEDLPRNENKNSYMSKQISNKLKKGAGEANQLALDGFAGCNGGFMVSQVTPCGIKVVARIDEYNELIWEAAIPFKAIFNIDSLTPAYAGKPVSVCFAVKAFKYPDSKTADNSGSNSMNNNMNSGTHGLGNTGRGGNMGSNPGAKVENPMQQLYEASKTWKVFGLVYQ